MGQKRKSNWLVAVMLVVFAANPSWAVRSASRSTPSNSAITARAAVLIDNNTGEVLWERNPNLPLPPASTTKVLTAMVALRSGRLDDSFLVSEDAAKEPPSKIYLRSGWRVRLLDLIYAIMLNSANDASVVIAEGIAGSVPAFADLMNAQAERLGATNSHFVNPNGLPAADHYSTARDLATMFSVAARDPVFDRIASTQSIPIIPTEGAVRVINLRTHNRLLVSNYPYEVIGKTGWTIAAKRCFVGAARVGDRELIVAVLGARDLWGDVRRLIEFGFNGSTRPEVEMAGVDADEVAVRSRAAGDDDDESDSSVYSGRASRVLRANRTQPAAVNVISGSSQRRTVVAKKSARLASDSKAKKQRKRKTTQLAKQSAHSSSTQVAKASRPATRSASAAQARVAAAKAPAKTKSRPASERPHHQANGKNKARHQ